MPQFVPIYTMLFCLFLWGFFCFIMSILWWASKRSYSLKIKK